MATKSKPSIAECLRLINSPGSLLETERKDINGQEYRVYKNLPPTYRTFILTNFQTYSDRIFLSSPTPALDGTGVGREHITFGETLQRALRLGAWLRSRGCGIGSRVAIIGGNCTGWIVSFVAAQLIGAITVCVNAWLPEEQLIHCLEVSKPHLILMDAERTVMLAPLAERLRSKDIMYCWSSTRGLSFNQQRIIKDLQQELIPTESEVDSVRKGDGLENLGPESDATIFFSSGTSGPPKAVLGTQRMGLSNVFSSLVAPYRAALRAGLPIPPYPTTKDPQRPVLLAIPLFHVTGCLSWLLRAIAIGNKIVMLPRWDVKQALELVQSEGVRIIGGVPAVVSAILQSPHLSKTQTFDAVFYGGAPPSKELAGEVAAGWPLAGLLQGYGMTETSAYVCSVAGRDYVERPDSTGPPVPISDIRIASPDTRKDLPTGETGLLLVRGPQVMKGYYGDEAATKKAIDGDGWLDTGDVGCVDDDGFLYIKDRLKDIIIRGGENIPSADVENAFHADKRVYEAVAIGLPDRKLGERVGVIVALRPGYEATTEEELIKTATPRLARYAIPSFVMLWDGPLPRNVNGKVVKKDLKVDLVKAWEEKQKSGLVAMGVKSKL